MNAEEQKEKAKALLKACDAGDVSAASALIADDFTFQFMDHSASWSVDGVEIASILDRETFLTNGVTAGEAVTRDGLNFEFDIAVGEGPYVALFGRSNGTSIKGKPYKNNYCWYVKFSGNNISELREYCDTNLAHQVLFD